MHWLIPAVTHSISSVCALLGNTLTPIALLVSIAFAASQSIHIWSAFYGLFAVYFFAGTCVAFASRFFQPAITFANGKPQVSLPGMRTATGFLANLLVVAALVPLHEYYMKLRLASVPWFHIFRAPAGCLPVPSRSFADEFQGSYTFIDALANQLPFGIVISYAMAMANAFSASLGEKSVNSRLTTMGTIAGALGALVVSAVAACTLPMCDDQLEGSHEVMMHVDRSTAWEERTNMTWSDQARYGTFILAVTLIGVTGSVVVDSLVGSHEKPTGVGAQGGKEAMSSKGKNQAPGTQEKPSSGLINRDVMSLMVHVVLAGGVVLGMALWSLFY